MAIDKVPIPEPAIDVGAALGADIEAEEVAALLPLAERPFDAATYRPRTHVPLPGGFLRFEGFIPGLDEDTLLREPMEHLSVDASTVRTLVDAVTFGPFCSRLIEMRAKSLLYGALVERWWDTTSSFHFSSTGEMTLTPYDFLMLTGLRVGVGDLVPFDPDMTQWRDAQLQLLGAIPDTTTRRIVRYSWFYDHFSGTQPVTADEVAQYTRGFMTYLFGTTLYANRENTVRLYILRALVHLSGIVDYDWGDTSLATLYYYMSSISRRKADSLGGY
ncbi:hypothetical protein ACSBR2_036605 [Camellia fascicularis]